VFTLFITGVASTKAYTSQFLALVLFGLVLSEDSISKDARRRDIIDGLQKLPDMIKSVLTCDEKIRDYAEDLHTKSSLLVMGRGFNFATCLEGALVRFNSIDMSNEICLVKYSHEISESQRINLHAFRRHSCW
jgi:glucosamine 6-phosphate synthetase-like amidotransferase/phosphosugar isomerase protein